MQIAILELRTGKTLCLLKGLPDNSTIRDVKQAFYAEKRQFYPDRQSFRTEKGAKSLKDNVTLESIQVSELFFKDLGPQIGWSTVFLAEYAGPLLTYLLFYFRPEVIYGATLPVHHSTPPVVHYAAICWTFHYAKRILETIFVHRFSNATMPLRNLFKNCTYYWGSAAFVSYYINHPLYTPAYYGDAQIFSGLGLFLFNELGNLSVHVTLRNLRPPGSTVRKIPMPDSNPFSLLFHLVSCPNYTYEVGSWIGFSVMTQSFCALLFALAGCVQMSLWALGKHRNYRREFANYPRARKAIIPFLL